MIKNLLILTSFLGQSLVYAGPLHDAVKEGNLPVVKRLLDIGADDIDKESDADNNYMTPIELAADRGHLEIVRELLNRGASIVRADSFPVVKNAASKGYTEIVKLLLVHARDSGLYERAYDDAIDYASRAGHTETVEEVEEFDSERQVYDYALKDAASKGQIETVKGLLNLESEKFYIVRNYEYALRVADSKGQKETVKAIRELSIENRIKLSYSKDILDGNEPGSYERDFAAIGSPAQRREAIEKVTAIPGGKGPASIIHGYLGISEEPKP